MASKTTGNQNAVFVEDGYDFDASGETYFEVWRGNRAVILAKAAALKTAGYRVQRRKHNGPMYQVTGTLSLAPTDGGGSESETPVDRYRIVTQTGLFDLRSNPKLIASAGSETTLETGQAFESGMTAERKLAAIVRANQEFIANSANDTTKWPTAWSAFRQAVADILARGAESYELKRPVLTRIRSFSTSYASPFVMEAQPKVYTTASLISTFAIPAAVQARLPATPGSAPTNTTWAWLWTQQDSDVIPALGKVQELDSWIFAAWSNALYTVV